MVPNEAEAPFVVLEALNISRVIGATYFRRYLCGFFLVKSPVRVLTLKLGVDGESQEGCRMCPPGSKAGVVLKFG